MFFLNSDKLEAIAITVGWLDFPGTKEFPLKEIEV